MHERWALLLQKYAGYVVSLIILKHIGGCSKTVLQNATSLGYDALKAQQIATWASIWEMADITIKGDVKAQQGIPVQYFSTQPNVFWKRR